MPPAWDLLNAQRRGRLSGRRQCRRRGERNRKGRGRALFQAEKWIKTDYNSKGQVKWRREAREDFDFEVGDQLNEEDKAILQDAKRPIVIFNRVGTTVDSVTGHEVGNQSAFSALHAC